MKRDGLLQSVALCIACNTCSGLAETVPTAGPADSRVRTATYNAEEVYRLEGRVGYQIDIQFAPGEEFVGLGAGDLQGLSFISQGSHLFLKPRAARVDTNLTVLTTLRDYHFDYVTSSRSAQPDDTDALYVLRFSYPAALLGAQPVQVANVDSLLQSAAVNTDGNLDYWFCGSTTLKPVAASDDGVHTRLRFAARGELPAIFVSNDDGSESLLNFSVQDGDVIIHRVARRFILRRGRLSGCIVNAGFIGSADRVKSGTVSPRVERTSRGGRS